MKYIEIAKKNTNDLYTMLDEAKKELLNFRIKKGLCQNEGINFSRIRVLKKDIARIMLCLSNIKRAKNEVFSNVEKMKKGSN